MKTIVHLAENRGHANHGWLDTRHSFSFAGYYDPERIHFGALRVLNDDIVKGGYGFGKHPHDNMEIVSIPLKGALEHGDSTGGKGVIRTGEIQIMSAGSGVTTVSEMHLHRKMLISYRSGFFQRNRILFPVMTRSTLHPLTGGTGFRP